jgi:hypothetical protein
VSRCEGKKLPTVFAIVLNWNNAPDTVACLASLRQMDYPDCEILVVDNGSQDGSVDQIRQRFPTLMILALEKNLGYTGGNNQGIKFALNHGCDYIWLLNDDVVVARDALTALIVAALHEPQAGFLGPKVYMREKPQYILSAGGLLNDNWQPEHRGIGELDEGQFDTVAEVGFLSGCALLVSRKAIETAGALAEGFFAYHEDVEWCYRVKKAGFKLLFVPEARVWHPDTRLRDADSPLVTYYMSRNTLLFLAKHQLGTEILLRSLVTYLLRLVVWSIRPKWRHKRRQRDALLRAIFDFGRGRSGQARWLEEL